MRVLIAEDDMGLRETMKIFMAKMGHVAHAAENGVKALNLLSNSQYDVLITDGFMPEMTGFELCRTVRARFPHILVIGLTGSSMLHEFEKSGAHAFFFKPVQFRELLTTIERLFRAEQVTTRQELSV